MLKDCLFCKIASGDIPSEKIYEDEHILAFLDIMPVSPGHTLIITKKHFRNILETPDSNLLPIMKAIKKVGKGIAQGVGANGINIHINNEAPAGQVIFHTHIHIIPRSSDDGLKQWHGHPYKEGEVRKYAEKIRGALHDEPRI